MKDEIIKTIMALVISVVAGTLVYVCDTFTVPLIATIITLTICCIAGWSIYMVCKMWILKYYKKWNTKRKR